MNTPSNLSSTPHRLGVVIAGLATLLTASDINTVQAKTATWLQEVIEYGYSEIGLNADATREMTTLAGYICTWNRKHGRDSKARAMNESCSIPAYGRHGN